MNPSLRLFLSLDFVGILLHKGNLYGEAAILHFDIFLPTLLIITSAHCFLIETLIVELRDLSREKQEPRLTIQYLVTFHIFSNLLQYPNNVCNH